MNGSNGDAHRNSERSKADGQQGPSFLVITPCVSLSENIAEVDLHDRSHVAVTQPKPKLNIHRGFLLFLAPYLRFQNRI